MNSHTESGRNDARDSLLNELESIRSLLNEHSEENASHSPSRISENDIDIPLLNDAIPVLQNSVPVLNDRISFPEKSLITTAPDARARSNPDLQLASVRAAAAAVAAKAVRNRATTSQTATPHSGESRDHEKLIAVIMSELQPQLESLVRNILRKHLTAQANNPTDNP